MNIHRIADAPESELAASLTRFEEQFTYPLGPGRSFRISHGSDYPRFFRAIGDARCFIAERDGEVLGVLCVAVTRVLTAEGAERSTVYLGDLKVAPTARGGRVLIRLAEAAHKWCAGRADCGFGVVMDGTRITPDRYTGRLGVPQFHEVAKIMILRVPTSINSQTEPGWETDSSTGIACFAQLSSGRNNTTGGDLAERSEMAPLWLMSPDGCACGRLEDTRQAKRLITDDRSEMIAAHLSCIGYANHAALTKLLGIASRVAAERGFPAFFASVPASEARDVLAALNDPRIVVAPATVFASGFARGEMWSINTAEI